MVLAGLSQRGGAEKKMKNSGRGSVGSSARGKSLYKDHASV